jgi:RHS repeat-associated protein
MKTLSITLLLLAVGATQVMGGQLNFLRADTSVFSFKSDGSLGLKRPPVKESSANPVTAHGLAIAKDSTNKLWTDSDQVNISGNVINVSLERGLVFHNDSTGDSVLLTNAGNLEANTSAEANLTRVDMYLDNHVIETDIANNQTKEYCGFGDGRIEYASGAAAERFYLKDHLGSTRAVIDQNGTLVEVVSYDAYGAIIKSDILAGQEEPTKEKFTGKEYDTSGFVPGLIACGMQLDYFGARYYDPEIGTWCSPDAVGQFFNPYAYAGNGTNPVSYIDEDGNFIQLLILGIWLGLATDMVSQGIRCNYALSHGGDARFNMSEWLWSGVFGGVSGLAGGAVGGAVSTALNGGFTGAVVGGAAGGAASGGITGLGMGLAMGMNANQAIENMWKGMAIGGIAGGVFGGVNYEIQKARFFAKLKNEGVMQEERLQRGDVPTRYLDHPRTAEPWRKSLNDDFTIAIKKDAPIVIESGLAGDKSGNNSGIFTSYKFDKIDGELVDKMIRGKGYIYFIHNHTIDLVASSFDYNTISALGVQGGLYSGGGCWGYQEVLVGMPYGRLGPEYQMWQWK